MAQVLELSKLVAKASVTADRFWPLMMSAPDPICYLIMSAFMDSVQVVDTIC